jgi:hypothetical protein
LPVYALLLQWLGSPHSRWYAKEIALLTMPVTCLLVIEGMWDGRGWFQTFN